MTIHVSKDVENAINAAVRSGQFASADEMVAKLVREYARSHPVQPHAHVPHAEDADTSPDPLLGLWEDYADEMDEIVADAYRQRREESWRELDL
jgi:Arc/MetJ-type ribon-helix-helix transcriptional regulator